MRVSEIISARPPLPALGEKPWWVSALAPMTRQLSGGGWSWISGGCFAFADRLQKAYGGQLWGVARYDPEFDAFDTEHAVVLVKGGYYDFNGVFDPAAYITKLARKDKRAGNGPYRREMRPKREAGWFDDEYLNDDQWRDLLLVLKSEKSL